MYYTMPQLSSREEDLPLSLHHENDQNYMGK